MERGLTVCDLSRRSGVSPSAIYNIESDEHRPHQSTVEALAGTLGVRASEIYLPRGVSHLGKPAQSGGRDTVSTAPKRGNICGVCFIEQSLTGVCDCTII